MHVNIVNIVNKKKIMIMLKKKITKVFVTVKFTKNRLAVTQTRSNNFSQRYFENVHSKGALN